RLGATAPVAVDFRVVAATNRDLQALVEQGRFRDDLFWRLNVFTIEIPPLRERTEDILPLAEHFLTGFTRSMSRHGLSLAPDARQALLTYGWPGNVRELRNAVERAVVVCSGSVVETRDLPVRVTSQQARPAA